MPNTIWGVVFLLIFLAPGFATILRIRRKVPLFVPESQIEYLLYGSVAGFTAHVCLLTLSLLVGFLICLVGTFADSTKVTLSLYFVKQIWVLFPKDAKSIQVLHLLMGLLYVLLTFAIAVAIGIYISKRLQKRGFDTMNLSPLIDTLSIDQVNYARALLDNEYVVTGIVEFIQADTMALKSENREIVFCSADVIDPHGILQPRIADKITVNTRDIKILEIATESKVE